MRTSSRAVSAIAFAVGLTVIVASTIAGGYLVSHTAFVYYIGRDGRLSGFGTWDDPQPVLDEDLGKIASSRRAP